MLVRLKLALALMTALFRPAPRARMRPLTRAVVSVW